MKDIKAENNSDILKEIVGDTIFRKAMDRYKHKVLGIGIIASVLYMIFCDSMSEKEAIIALAVLVCIVTAICKYFGNQMDKDIAKFSNKDNWDYIVADCKIAEKKLLSIKVVLDDNTSRVYKRYKVIYEIDNSKKKGDLIRVYTVENKKGDTVQILI